MDDLGPSSLEPPPAKRPRLDRDEYRVRVAGRDFVLNREQVEADAPSLLSMSLLGEWAEGEERVLDLKHAHDPDLFRLVVNHLRGYTILPLDRQACPPTMSIEATLANLQIMAGYLDLSRLEELLMAARAPPPAPPTFDPRPSVTLVDHPSFPLTPGRAGLTAEDPEARVCLRLTGWRCSIEGFSGRQISAESDVKIGFDWREYPQLKTAMTAALGQDALKPQYKASAISFSFESAGDGDSECVPVTLRDRGPRGDEQTTVRCGLTTLWGYFFWAKTTENDEAFVAEEDRQRICSFFKLPMDPDEEIQGHLTLGSALGRPSFVADELLVVVAVASDSKSTIDFKGVLSVELSTPALWSERVAESLRG